MQATDNLPYKITVLGAGAQGGELWPLYTSPTPPA